MANIKSNIKSIRKQKKRNLFNRSALSSLNKIVKAVRTNPTKENLTKAFAKIDSLASQRKIHQNKANRLKGRLTNLLNKTAKKHEVK